MISLAFIQNLGMGELVIIFLAVLLIFGPKALPQLGRSLGDGMREFKNATSKITSNLTTSMEDEEQKGRMQGEVKRQAALTPAHEGSTAPVPAQAPAPSLQSVDRDAR